MLLIECGSLLGREREFKNSVVRVHAVKTLERSSDDELIDYLLQLVQALRYEPDSSMSGSSVSEDGMLPGHGAKAGEVVSPLANFLVVGSNIFSPDVIFSFGIATLHCKQRFQQFFVLVFACGNGCT